MKSVNELFREPENSFYHQMINSPTLCKSLHKGRLYETKEDIHTLIFTHYLALVKIYEMMKGSPLFLI